MNTTLENTVDKVTTTLALDRKANTVLDIYCRTSGRSKKYVVSRLVEWFVDMDLSVRGMIMGEIHAADEAAMLTAVLTRRTVSCGLEESRTTSVNRALYAQTGQPAVPAGKTPRGSRKPQVGPDRGGAA